jgi:hypothetical protein
MADVWVILGVLAFFAVCVALVKGCDLIIGPDDASDLAIQADDETTGATGSDAASDATVEVGAG